MVTQIQHLCRRLLPFDNVHLHTNLTMMDLTNRALQLDTVDQVAQVTTRLHDYNHRTNQAPLLISRTLPLLPPLLLPTNRL